MTEMTDMNPRETGFGVAIDAIQEVILDALADRYSSRPFPDGWNSDDMSAYVAALEEAKTLIADRDKDTVSVQEACSDFGNDEGPRGIRQLYARFEDRIKRLP